MGHIKEPLGVDFIVAPSILTEMDRLKISQIIAAYKQTGIFPTPSQRTQSLTRPKKIVALENAK